MAHPLVFCATAASDPPPPPSQQALSAARKDIVCHLHALQKFARSLPHIIPAPSTTDSDAITKLLLSANLLESESSPVKSPEPLPHMAVSFQGSLLTLQYRPSWFKDSNQTTYEVSTTDYDTPGHPDCTSPIDAQQQSENRLQSLEALLKTTREFLLVNNTGALTLKDILASLYQALIAICKLPLHGYSLKLAELLQNPLLDRRCSSERGLFDALGIELQSKILSIDVLRLAILAQLPIQKDEEAVQTMFPIPYTNSALLLQTDLMYQIYRDVEHFAIPPKEQVQLLELATLALREFYSNSWQRIPANLATEPPSASCLIHFIDKGTIHHQLHFLLNVMGDKQMASALLTNCARTFAALWSGDRASELITKVLMNQVCSSTQQPPSKSILMKIIVSLIEHVLEGTLYISEELYKPQNLYKDVVLGNDGVAPPLLFASIVRLLMVPSPESTKDYFFPPKLVMQTILQQISTIVTQNSALKDTLSALVAFSYQYLMAVFKDRRCEAILWKDLPAMIVSFCDKQLQSSLPSQTVVSFIRIMLDMLGFLFLLSQRSELSDQAKQSGTHLLSFFLSFFSIVSKSVQLQSHIILLLTRLSAAISSVPMWEPGANLLKLIDAGLIEILLGLLDSGSFSVTLLDTALNSFIEPIRNDRLTPESLANTKLLPKLKTVLRTMESLALTKTIVHLFVTVISHYYITSLANSVVSLIAQLNSMLTTMISLAVFTRDNTVAMGIMSILLPAMRAALPPLGIAWQFPTNSVSREIGLLICITSQNESRIFSFVRLALRLDANHRSILRDVQREVLRQIRNLLYKSTDRVGIFQEEVTETEDVVSFARFSPNTLANILLNFMILLVILAKEFGDDLEENIPFCVTQTDQCMCGLGLTDDNRTLSEAELEPKIKTRANIKRKRTPPYVKTVVTREGMGRSKVLGQRKRGINNVLSCYADSAISMLFHVTRMLITILPNIIQHTSLPDSVAVWIDNYLVEDEQRRLFLTHAFRMLALGARIHIYCLSRAEQEGKLYGFQAHMTAGSMLDQYTRTVSLFYLILDTVDVHVTEHIVTCLVQYVRWDNYYKRVNCGKNQAVCEYCSIFINIYTNISAQLLKTGALKVSSELIPLSYRQFDLHLQKDKIASTCTGSIIRYLYLLTLLARGFNSFSCYDVSVVKSTFAKMLTTSSRTSTTVDELEDAYNNPVKYMLQLLSVIRATTHDLVQPVAVCQYTLLGDLPLMFIQASEDAIALRSMLRTDCTQIALHPLIADVVFHATTSFFNTRITEEIVSSVSISSISEDTDTRESHKSTSSLSTSKSPSLTDNEKIVANVFTSAKAEERRLHIQKRFANTIIPYCNIVLEEYCFKSALSLSVPNDVLIVKTHVHVLHCIRQIITSKLVLPEYIVPTILAFQLSACHNHSGVALMPIVYEDVLDSLTLALTVFKRTVCIITSEKAIEIILSSKGWRLLVERSKHMDPAETKYTLSKILFSVQLPCSVVLDLYNIILVENTGYGAPKENDSDALFVSCALNCLTLPEEESMIDMHDTLLRFFFVTSLLLKLPFGKYRAAAAVGTIIQHFSDYSIRNYNRIQTIESTGGETLSHSFAIDLFAYLSDCMMHLFTTRFDYVSKGGKEEIAREPRRDLRVFERLTTITADCVTGATKTLNGLIELKSTLL